MENSIANVGLINSIDKQIEELQRRKEELQMGYCYIPGFYNIETHTNIRLSDKKEENK